MKYILNEKFILAEAEREPAEIIIDLIKKITPNIKNILASYTEEKSKIINNTQNIKKLQIAADKINLEDDDIFIVSNGNAYSTAIKKFLGNESTSAEYESNIDQLDAAIKANNSKDIQFAITSITDTLSKKLQKANNKTIIEKLTEVIKVLNTTENKAKKVITSAKDALEIRKYLEKLTQGLSIAEEATDKENAIIKVCNTFLDSPLLKLQNNQTEQNIDWDGQFRNTLDKEARKALWNKYFKTVWKKYAEKVANFGYGLKEKLISLGFNEAENPFITFTKIIIKKDLNVSATSYLAITKAYDSKYLTDDDLRGTGPAGENNLIFSNLFYDIENPEKLEYLTRQQQAIKLYSSKGFTNEILENKYTNIVEFLTDLFYTPGNTIINSTKRVSGDPKMGLKAFRTIDHELNVCFNEKIKSAAEDRKVEAAPIEIENITKQLSGKTDYINLIKYLIISFAKDSIEQEVLRSKYIDLKSNDAPDMIEVSKFKDMFKDNNIKGKELENIITQLAKKGNLN